MKNLLFLFILLLITFSTKGQEANPKNKEFLDIERGFFIEKQLDLYTVLPTTLSLWSHSDWSSISFQANQTDGEFKMINELKKSQKLSFKTESVQSFSKKGLKLYGNFTYNTANHEGANWNLFFKKSEIGSPFSIITNKIGDWRTKHYGLSGIITKEISPRLQLGIGMKYYGDLYFRILDTRNEQYNLTIDFQSSITYLINKNNYLSLGIAYHKNKVKPEMGNDFKLDESLYQVHFTEGFDNFGNILVEDYDKLVITDKNPNFTLAYHSGAKNKLTLNYSFYPGKEEWEINRQSIDSNSEKEYKYDYIKHNTTGSYLVNTDHYHLLNKLSFQLVSGKGYTYTEGYHDAYIYDGFDADASIDLLRKNKKFFDQTGLTFGFENVSKKDLKNSQLLEYTNVNLNFQTGCHFALNEANKIKLNVKGGYKYNLSYTHNLGSGKSADYTINLAHNEMAYHTADYYNLGGKLSWFHQFKNSAIEWAFDINQIIPTDIKISNQYSILEKSTNRTYIGLNFNLIF